jgi:hypothetical protein
VLEHLESELRRREEDAVAALAEPQRAPDAAREVEQVGIALVQTAKIASESTVIRGSAREQSWRLRSSSSFVMIPLWMPSTGP